MPAKLRPLRVFLNGPRAKPRLALGVALSVLAATAAWSFTRPKIYEATALYQAHYYYQLDWDCLGDEFYPIHRDELEVFERANFARSEAGRASLNSTLQTISIEKGSKSQGHRVRVRLVAYLYKPYPGKPFINISLAARDPDPEQAARVATAVAQELHAWWTRTKQEEIRSNVSACQRLIERMQGLIQKSETDANADKSADVPPEPVLAAQERERMVRQTYIDLANTRRAELIASLPAVGEKHSVIPAEIPADDDYVSPNHPLNLALGLLAGLALGTLVSTLATRRAAREPGPSASET